MEVAPAEPSDGASGGDPKAAPLHGLGARRLVGLSSAVSIPGFARGGFAAHASTWAPRQRCQSAADVSLGFILTAQDVKVAAGFTLDVGWPHPTKKEIETVGPLGNRSS